MYWEIDARSENLVKNGVIRCRSRERVSATLQLRLVSAYGRLTGPLAGKTESPARWLFVLCWMHIPVTVLRCMQIPSL
jgi:hypothetical protein